MKTTICRPGDLGDSELACWREFQSSELSLQNPFLSPEFAIAVDAVRSDARVAVVEQDGEIAGFLAYSAGPFGLARPVAPGMCDLQAFVHRPGLHFEPSALVASTGLRAFRFDHLLGSQDNHQAATATVPADSWLIEFEDGWEGYVSWAEKERGRYLNWLERKQRRFIRDHPDAEFTYAAHDPAGLRALMALKTEQCKRMGWEDVFAEDWVRQLVERLAEMRTAGLAGGLSSLRIDGAYLAVDFSLLSERLYAGWLIAYDDSLASSSPGAVRWRYLLEAAAAAGIRRVDLGKGADDFKRRFSTGTLPLAEGMWGAAGAVPGCLVFAERLGRSLRSRLPAVEERVRRSVRTIRRYRARAV